MEENLIKELAKSVKNRDFYNDSDVYNVGENAVAKEGIEGKVLSNEFIMGVDLFSRGIQVPEMYSLVSLDSLRKFEELPEYKGYSNNNWFIIMQKIKGKLIKDVAGEERKEAVKQLKTELEKIIKLGIYPEDAFHQRNSIFSDEGKLYLIDFAQWRKSTKEELEKFHEHVMRYR